jgi:hypothetical protein
MSTSRQFQFSKDAIAATLTGAALVVGWLCITLGIAAIARPRLVWPLSIGLLFVTAAGWRLLFTIGAHGLYSLTKDTDDA